MLHLLWLVLAVPFASTLVLALAGSRFPRRLAAILGAGSIGVSAVLAALVAGSFLSTPPPGGSYAQVLWTWIDVGGFHPQIALYLDAVSLVMILVVTFVAFWIHLYSTEFMQ